MKLFYNKNSKDPIYYAQIGIRNGKKVTTRNVKRFGKHSELLKITDDPLAYVKEEIRKMNEEYRVGRMEHTISTDYNEKVERTDDEASREFDSHPLLKRLTGLIKPIFFCQILNFILHVPLKYGIIERGDLYEIRLDYREIFNDLPSGKNRSRKWEKQNIDRKNVRFGKIYL